MTEFKEIQNELDTIKGNALALDSMIVDISNRTNEIKCAIIKIEVEIEKIKKHKTK